MTQYPEVAPRVEWIEIENEVLVFDGDLLHLLPGSSAQIWLAINGDRSTASIATSLSMRHPDALEVGHDVRYFVSELAHRGLVRILDKPSGNGLAVPPWVAWTLEGGQVVLADLRSGGRQGLSVTASRLWQLMAARLPLDQLVEQLRLEFPDAPADLATVVKSLLQTLTAQGLLSQADDLLPD